VNSLLSAHQKIVRVSAPCLFDVLGKKCKIVKSDIPDDAKYVRCFIDSNSFPESFCIVMEHEDFPETPLGYIIPWNAMLTIEEISEKKRKKDERKYRDLK
jgi:hypothetical protein